MITTENPLMIDSPLLDIFYCPACKRNWWRGDHEGCSNKRSGECCHHTDRELDENSVGKLVRLAEGMAGRPVGKPYELATEPLTAEG